MSRLETFGSPFGANWVAGRYLLPALRRLGAGLEGDVLDLACGESPFRTYFPNVRHYYRLDRADSYPAVRGDLVAIPFQDASFDAVLLFQAITDVPDMRRVLKEVRRVLRDGGCLIVFESMCYPEHDAPHDYYRLMPQGLRSLARTAGLIETEYVPLGGLFTRFASLWGGFVMGGLRSHPFLRPVAAFGTLCGNLSCYFLDWLVPHPRLASDYLTVLTASGEASAPRARRSRRKSPAEAQD